MFRTRVLLIVFFLLGFFGSRAQQVRVEAVLDTSKMRIGEQVNVDLYLSYDASMGDLSLQWPDISDTLTSKVEVISASAIDTTLPSQSNSPRVFQHQRITVSVYDSGYYAIPPFKFILNNDSANALYTNPLLLEVHTVPTDTSAAKIKDIKPPLEEPFNWKWYLDYVYWGAGILLAILGLIFLVRYLGRRNRKVEPEPVKPKIPAHIPALQALEKIKSEQVWREGHVKQYYSSISDTVRLYIENRYGTNALESTTEEIMISFRTLVVDEESKNKLRQLLMLSDLVKFAKMTPIEVEHELTLNNAFDFVNGTKREENLEPEKTEERQPE